MEKQIIPSIVVESRDKTLKYELIYLSGPSFKVNHRGKHWPRVTQCLLFINGFICCAATVTKHVNDPDDVNFALRLVTKAVAVHIHFKDMRSEVWDKLFKHTLFSPNKP